MVQFLHWGATTTATIRRAIQRSQESMRSLTRLEELFSRS